MRVHSFISCALYDGPGMIAAFSRYIDMLELFLFC